jgi:hypothetical protein
MFSFFFELIRGKKFDNIQYGILLDQGTSAFLVIGEDTQLISFLDEHIFDSFFLFLRPRNRFEARLIRSLMGSDELFTYGWNRKDSTIIRIKHFDNGLRAKSELARRKYNTLREVSYSIQYLRLYARKTLAFQESIYTAKKDEARRFKDKNYPESDILEYPYILQYADYRNISFKEACEAILTKASLGDADFAKTETLRIKYFNKIKEAKTSEDLDKILYDFGLEVDIKL